ncbi:MAG: SRPBCC family protein [Phycicoccus sp.]
MSDSPPVPHTRSNRPTSARTAGRPRPDASFPRRLVAIGRLHPDVVWARYTRPSAWSTWAPHIRSVDYPLDTIAAGTAGRVHGPPGVTADFRIDEVDPDARRWSWSVRSGPLRLRFDHGADPHPHGCSAWMTTDAAWPLVLGYAPLASWALGRLVTPRS